MAVGEAYLYPTKFNFDRAGSHPIRARLDRRQPPPAPANFCWSPSPHRYNAESLVTTYSTSFK